jgi:uncharacterized membrane protein YcaP (DUF421 family)
VEDYTFDLQRILIGDAPLLFAFEIALRTAIMLFYSMLLLRILGRRGLAQLSLFEFVLIIALGSAVGDPMFYPEIPVLHGMIVITVVVAIERLLIWATNRSDKLENVIEGTPHRLIADGRFDIKGLETTMLSRAEIYMELRLDGVEQMGQVRRAYLEINGKMSIFQYDDDSVRPGLPVLPGMELGEAEPLRAVSEAGDYACLYCGEVASLEAGKPLPSCPRCQHNVWIEAAQ